MSQSRQLAAIMFTDIVGYTTLMNQDENLAFTYLNKNRELQKPIIELFNGKWIKELGDGVMASFPTASDAVNAAVSIQEGCITTNDFQLRIGIHLGEVVFEKGDVFGNGVNIAARLQTAAKPGCIFISEVVRNNVSNKREVETLFVREEKLKNVSQPVKMYQVLYSGGEKITPESAQLNIDTKSIAVLPFVNMSNDHEQEYFSDGISEEIINILAQVQGLKVTARTSSFAFKGKNQDLRVIGEQLRVHYILEGSVRKAGHKLRITAQLIKADDGFHLYSEKFDREMDDVFSIQDEIALAILNAIELKILGKEREAILKRYTDNVKAYGLFLNGLYHYNQLTPVSMARAIEDYQSAIALDPNYAIAYAEMGSCYWDLAYFLWAPGVECLPKALPAINKALRLDPLNDVCHIALGRIQLWYGWDFEEADNELKKGLEINPNNVEGLRQLGALYLLQGHHEKSFQYIGKADSLDPFSLLGLTYSGMYHWYGGFFERMLEYANRMITLEPNFFGGHLVLGMGYIGLSKYDKAVEAMEVAAKLNADIFVLSFLGIAYAYNGQQKNAEETLVKMKALAYQNEGNAYFGYVYFAMNDWDRAFDHCFNAAKNHEGAALALPSMFRLKAPEMLNDPRTIKLLKLIGLPD